MPEREVSKVLPRAYIAHHIPGRIRIRIPVAKGNSPLLQRLRELVQSVPGVERVDSTPLTGSLLIHYGADAFKRFEGLLSATADSAASFSLVSAPAEAKDLACELQGRRPPPFSDTASAIVDYFKDLDGRVKSATDNALDLKVLLPLAAATIGIFAIRKAIVTPLWLTLLLFSFSSFLSLHSVERTEPGDSNGPASHKEYLH